jgi:RNA polymerase sigma-70 factor (ECF subfamily)
MPTGRAQERFESLILAHGGIVAKICRSYCAAADDREDLAQEIVTQLWRSFGRFDERMRFSTWMYRVSLNTAISFARRERTRRRHRADGDPELLATIRAKSEPEREAPTLVYDFIERLDGLNKALLLLYLEDNTYHEIADILGLTETNVATKLSRLKATMKRSFNADRPRAQGE